MGIFPVEFPTTTADSFESFRVLHYLAFIKEEDVLIETGLFTTEDAEDTKVNLGGRRGHKGESWSFLY